MKTILFCFLMLCGLTLQAQNTLDTNYFWFEHYYIEDFIYNPFDNQYIIEYSDEDIPEFDEDCKGEDYIQIETPKELFFEVLSVYSETPELLCNLYQVKEVITQVEGGLNYRYYLIRI